MASPNSSRTQESSELLSGVISDAREIASAEVDKLKGEVRQVGASAKATAIGLGILIVAGVLVGQALCLGLFAAGLPLWVSFAIVGVVVLISGIAFIRHPRGDAKAT